METRRTQSLADVVERLDSLVSRLEQSGGLELLGRPVQTPEERQAVEIAGARHRARNWKGAIPDDELEQLMTEMYGTNVEALQAGLDELRQPVTRTTGD